MFQEKYSLIFLEKKKVKNNKKENKRKRPSINIFIILLFTIFITLISFENNTETLPISITEVVSLQLFPNLSIYLAIGNPRLLCTVAQYFSPKVLHKIYI